MDGVDDLRKLLRKDAYYHGIFNAKEQVCYNYFYKGIVIVDV
jgi:hypothetical protein